MFGACNGSGEGYWDASRDVVCEGRVDGLLNMEFGGTGGRFGERFKLKLGEVRDGEKEGAAGLKGRRGGGMLVIVSVCVQLFVAAERG